MLLGLGRVCWDVWGLLLRESICWGTAAQLAAVRDELPQHAVIPNGAPEEQDGADGDSDDSVAPDVATEEGGADSDEAEAKQRLAWAIAIGARSAAALTSDDELVSRPGVEEERCAEKREE